MAATSASSAVALHVEGCNFEWNENRPELKGDRNENKHREMALRAIKKGGRRDVFLGTRECQAYVEPCVFGSGEGDYDDITERAFGLMYHGITYPDEAYSPETEGRMTIRFWKPVMKKGVIAFVRPEDCALTKPLRDGMKIKEFGTSKANFSSVNSSQEVL